MKKTYVILILVSLTGTGGYAQNPSGQFSPDHTVQGGFDQPKQALQIPPSHPVPPDNGSGAQNEIERLKQAIAAQEAYIRALEAKITELTQELTTLRERLAVQEAENAAAKKTKSND